jgi:filamentous hemagglutinin family protein
MRCASSRAGAASQVLNRVTGNDPSAILGSLSSNGRVWLLNPNGVLFGQSARVDVAGLVTSTLNLNNADWLAGNFRFTQGPGAPAAIVNQGELRSSLGGEIALIGATVRNEGQINAPGGRVLLAAGSSVELIDSATPNVGVKVNSAAGEVVNLGSLLAAGGRIDVHAGTVNQSGIVRADSLASGPGGEIVLQATERLTLAGASETTATGANGQGGKVKLLGREVGLLDSARVDASGASGGGEVLVGGGQQGKDASVPNARAVYFGPAASIAADAIGSGDGGKIILWSDEATRAFGSLSARGGADAGDGGFIETSGGWLDARPSKLDLSAPKGTPGQWLLDPFNITINDAGPDTGYDASFTANANGSTISTGVIKGQLELGTDVTISTGGVAGAQAGDITMSSATLSVNSSGPGNLTLIADGSITMTGSTIQSLSEAMNISFQAGRAGSGSVSLQFSNISSGNGDITLGGFGNGLGVSSSFGSAAFSTTGVGVQIANSGVNAGTGSLGGGGGTLTIRGASSANFDGVRLTGQSALTARNIVILGSSTGAANGVEFGIAHATVPGNMSVEGVGGRIGVLVGAGSTISSSPTSGNALVSLVGASMGNFNGVQVTAGINAITANNGNSVSILAANVAGATAPALLVIGTNITVGSAPGSLTLGIINPAIDNDIVVNGSTLSGTAGGIRIFGANNLTLQDTSMPGRTMQFQADHITLAGATSMVSPTPSGDIYVFSNRSGNGPLASFTNNSTVGTSGSNALQTSGAPARWIIWAADITSPTFSPGSLPYDFVLYGASSPSAWNAMSGNGYVSAAPGVAAVTGTINSRVYDATLNVPLQGSLAATGPRGEVGSLSSPPGLQYVDKNVGVGKPIALVGSYTATFTDGLGKPVFGVTLQSGMSGDVTLATVPLQGLSGNNKVYDSTTAATYAGTASVTPLGSDNVTVSIPNGAPAFFADKNVGNGKAISIPSMTLAGTDAGNYLLIPPA